MLIWLYQEPILHLYHSFQIVIIKFTVRYRFLNKKLTKIVFEFVYFYSFIYTTFFITFFCIKSQGQVEQYFQVN